MIVRRRDGTQARLIVQRRARVRVDAAPDAAPDHVLREFDRSTGHYLDNTAVYATG